MPDRASGFEHQDAAQKDDATLRREARDHLASNASAQVVAELLHRLRALKVTWWSPEVLRASWPASSRMKWYRSRPDLRQQITTGLTGLAPKACRKKEPDFQAALIDSVLDDGDIDVDRFELAFDPSDLAVYAPPAELWRLFHQRMPWKDDDQQNLDLIAWLLRALLAEKSSLDGMTRKPVLTAWDVRTNIDGKLWHTRMPLEVRVEIDEARLRLERSKPNEPFHAKDELSIAVPELIAAKIPLEHLTEVFRAAEVALGFERPRAAPDTGLGALGAIDPSQHASGIARPKAGEAREQGARLRATEQGTQPDPTALARIRRSDVPSAPRSSPGGAISDRLYEAPTPAAGMAVVSEPSPRTTPSAPPPTARPSQPSTVPGSTTRSASAAPPSIRPSAPPASGVPRPGATTPSAPPAALRPSATPPVKPVPAGPTRPSPTNIEAPATDENAPQLMAEEGFEDLEQTNPWIVPSDEELLVDGDGLTIKQPRPDAKDGAPPGKRRRPPK